MQQLEYYPSKHVVLIPYFKEPVSIMGHSSLSFFIAFFEYGTLNLRAFTTAQLSQNICRDYLQDPCGHIHERSSPCGEGWGLLSSVCIHTLSYSVVSDVFYNISECHPAAVPSLLAERSEGHMCALRTCLLTCIGSWI